MNQNSLFRRFVVIALLFALGSLFIAPGSTHAQENGDQGLDLNQIKSIEEVDSINSYRAHMSVKLSGEVFEQSGISGGRATFTLDGEFVKNPLAQHIIMSFDENGVADELEVIIVDDRSYIKIDGQWEETGRPALSSNDINDIINATNQADIPDTSHLWKSIGIESVNGRQTVHYRADKESLAELSINEPQAQIFFANGGEAQLDLWVDQSEKFIVKVEMTLEGKGFDERIPDASGRIEFLIEFYDFNTPITITAPEVPKRELHLGPDTLPLAKEMLEKSQK